MTPGRRRRRRALPGALLALLLLAGGAGAQTPLLPEGQPLSTAPASGEAFEPEAVSSGSLRLALIEPEPHRVSTTLGAALERLLRDTKGAAALLEARTFPFEHSGLNYRFPFPAESGMALALAARLDSAGETAFVVPPVPSLVEGLLRAARDPSSYEAPWSVSFSSSRVSLAVTRLASGEPAASTSFNDAVPWSRTIGSSYRLDWDGVEARVFVAAKPYGGLARMASALAAESARGPLVGVARGGLFGVLGMRLPPRELEAALERLGLKASAVGCSELIRFEEIAAYRSERPAGFRLLSANLVYSSAPAQTVFDEGMIVEAGGLKVLLVGITPPACAKFLPQAGLGHLAIADPLATISSRAGAWRSQADGVVVLADLEEGTPALEARARGVDVIVGEDRGSPDQSLEPAETRVEQRARREFDTPLLSMKSYAASLGLLELKVERRASSALWAADERHLRLDESFPEAEGLPGFDPESYGLSPATGPALVPAPRTVFPDERDAVWPRITDQGFWSMAASLLAERTGSEAALLRVKSLGIQLEGELREGLARLWLQGDAAVVVPLTGAQLKPLVAEAERQRQRVRKRLPPGGSNRYAAGGIGPDGTIHGGPIAAEDVYRVAVSRVLLDALKIRGEREPEPVGTVSELVVDALKAEAGSPPARYAGWMDGRPVRTKGLWRLNFRDVGLNVQSTRVVRDDDFNSVPNSRIQGFDELLLGWVFKGDAEYLRSPYKWKNTFELEYARSAVTRRNQATVVNITANSLRFLTLGTRRTGGVGAIWLARSWGPSLGVQYEGQVEAVPGLRRREVYSLFPGVELYDGSWIRSLEASASVKRDQSRDPPGTQYGLRTHLTVGHDIGSARGRPVSLQGEAYASYHVLTDRDTPQDLRLEGGVIAKLRIPVYKHLSVAPFMDFYFFSLKVKPVWGYSAVTGITIGFSRLWKPQYEAF